MAYRIQFRSTRRARIRAGQVLLEFALIALILFGLLAATIDFGRSIYAAQAIQQAADHIAREMSVTPIAAIQTFDLDDATFSKLLKDNGIYSEDFLAIDITNQTGDLLSYLDTLNIPSGNRILVPLMVPMDSSQNSLISAGTKLLVYPGALVASSSAASGLTVRIPLVTYPSEGVEAIEPDQSKWLRVVEGVKAMNPATGTMEDLLPITSFQRGIVAVRVNYPFQAAGFSATNAPASGPTTPQGAYIEVPAGEELQSGQVGGPYSGPTGLGQQAAFTKTVRPFRRVISAQGVYRREIFN